MRSALVIGVLPLLLLNTSSAQNTPDRSSSDVTLTFRIGEVIPLELAFASVAPGKYQLDTASYDRSGRLNEEKFAIEPTSGWDDPLDLYFHSYQGFIGGGLRGFNVLSAKPATIQLEVNEWIRFREPGRYRVTVVSGRVSKLRSPLETVGVSVTSNQLTLTIVRATEEWQQSTLKAALDALDHANPPRGAKPAQSDPRQQAVKTLRYLGSASAAREMAHRLTGMDADRDFTAGLVGSPAREAALVEMRKLLVGSNFAVTDRFLSAMSVVALSGDIAEDLPAQREKMEDQFRQELVNALGAKQGAALAVSTNTIIEDAAMRSRLMPAHLKRKLTEQLMANFDKLPVQKQAELIQYRWSALDHKEMLPLLRKIATRYLDFSELRKMDAYEYNNTSAAALEHWYEISPDEARPVVIKEMLRPKPRFNASVLGMLPDKELPEVEQALVEHLNSEQSFDVSANIATLIHRYTTSVIEGRVTAFLDPVLGKLGCAMQQPVLAYVLKVDPDGARPRLESAMAARGEGFSACNHGLLPEIAKLQNHQILQEIALRALDDPDPQIVSSAAAYLMEYGASSAEDVLWSRFTAWSERWQGREDELQYVPGTKLDGTYESGAGSNLMQALAAGQGWLADETKLRRLIDLSVASQQRHQAEQYLATWRARPWSIQFIPFDRGQFQIAQYHAISLQAVEDKLLQFPRGSSFQWSGGGGTDDEENAFRKISQFASEHGLKVLAAHH